MSSQEEYLDSLLRDINKTDTKKSDENSVDTIITDEGVTDANIPDMGGMDADIADMDVMDANIPDMGVMDADIADIGVMDSNITDIGGLDANIPDVGGIDLGDIDLGPAFDSQDIEAVSDDFESDDYLSEDDIENLINSAKGEVANSEKEGATSLDADLMDILKDSDEADLNDIHNVLLKADNNEAVSADIVSLIESIDDDSYVFDPLDEENDEKVARQSSKEKKSRNKVPSFKGLFASKRTDASEKNSEKETARLEKKAAKEAQKLEKKALKEALKNEKKAAKEKARLEKEAAKKLTEQNATDDVNSIDAINASVKDNLADIDELFKNLDEFDTMSDGKSTEGIDLGDAENNVAGVASEDTQGFAELGSEVDVQDLANLGDAIGAQDFVDLGEAAGQELVNLGNDIGAQDFVDLGEAAGQDLVDLGSDIGAQNFVDLGNENIPQGADALSGLEGLDENALDGIQSLDEISPVDDIENIDLSNSISLGGDFSNVTDLPEADAILDFSDAMQSGDGTQQQNGQDKPQENGEKKKKKNIFSKLFELLTEEEESEEKSAIQLSDENKEILDELDNSDDKKKGKKEKKAKKNKKGKKGKEENKEEEGDERGSRSESDEDAEADDKKKKKKPKKEKKPKKVKIEEESEPVKNKLSFKRMLPIFGIGISLTVLLIVLTNLTGSFMVKREAREAFYNQDYETCYQNLYGKDLNESDMVMYGKSESILRIRLWMREYEMYVDEGDEARALECLVQVVFNYPDLYSYSQRFNAQNEVDNIYAQIISILNDKYNLSAEQAAEIANTKSDVDYSRKIYTMINGGTYGDWDNQPLKPNYVEEEEQDIMQDVLSEEAELDDITFIEN